jgi:DNA-binding NarL/FixJ family response regulator
MHACIIDPHPLMRNALAEIFFELSINLTLFFFDSLKSFLDSKDTNFRPCLIVTEIVPLDVQNIALVNQLFPDALIVVYSSEEKAKMEISCLIAGANCYIEKTVSSEFLRTKFLEVLSFVKVQTKLKISLPPRQLELLIHISKGLTNEAIGLKLNIKTPTVKVHLTRLFKKLKVTNRVQAVNYARSMHLI